MRQLSKVISEGRYWRRLVQQCLFLLIVTLGVSSAAAQNLQLDSCTGPAETPHPLGPDASHQRDIKANELHVYELTISTGQYVQVTVEQKGIDVIVRLLGPGRTLVIERDSLNRKFGPERISAIAQSTGTYHVEVCSGRNEPNGAYNLTLVGPRTKTATDENEVKAGLLLQDGGRQYSNCKRDYAACMRAIDSYTEALNIWKELGNDQEQGYTLSAIGEVHRYLRHRDEAIKSLNDAIPHLKAANDPSGESYVQNTLGAAKRDLTSNPASALENYEAALSLRQRLGDRSGEAQIHNNIGHLYTRLGRNVMALEHLNAALPLWQALGVRRDELNTLNNIAVANVEIGNTGVAYQQFQDLMRICPQEKELCSEASARNGLGMVYDVWGQPNDAYVQFTEALKLFKEQGESGDRGKANVLDNLGMLFAGLDDPQSALEHLQSALEIRQKLNIPGDEAATRSHIGYVQSLLRNPADALIELDKALRLSEKSNERFKGYTLMRMGIVASAEDKPKALGYYQGALDVMKSIGDVRGEAIILDKMAALNASSDQLVKARQQYLDAQKLWQRVDDLQGEAGSLYGLAKLERAQNNLIPARENIMKANEKVESLLTRMTNHRLRRTYFEARHDYYALETDIRMRLYDASLAKNDLTGAQKELEAAVYAAERGRARNLLNLLTESRTNIRQEVNSKLLDRERTERNLLAGKLELLQNVLAQKGKETQKAQVQREVQAAQRSLEQTLADIRASSPRYAALTQPEPLRPAKIQEQLDGDTCILQYALGDERSYLWLITRQKIVPYTLPGRTAIERATGALLDAIRIHEPREDSGDRFKQAQQLRQAEMIFQRRARELSSLILDPVGSRIANKRLVIVADGALELIPFSALPVPPQSVSSRARARHDFVYLIARHEIVYEPSASVLALLQLESPGNASRTAAIFADPVFSKTDSRIKTSASTDKPDPISSLEEIQLRRALRDAGDTASVDGPLRLIRLRYSRVEADAIAAAAPPGSSMEALDFDANRAAVLSDELKQFKIVHLATHGILNTVHPELSGLVFSLVDKEGKPRPGFLRLSDVYNLNLSADLVVLSACESGIGEQLRGEGLVGLTRGFMYAGAERVVASLWKVNDVATSELMKRFYASMLNDRKPASVALRQAQLEMLARGDRFSPPFFWAGFVLQGEWK